MVPNGKMVNFHIWNVVSKWTRVYMCVCESILLLPKWVAKPTTVTTESEKVLYKEVLIWPVHTAWPQGLCIGNRSHLTIGGVTHTQKLDKERDRPREKEREKKKATGHRWWLFEREVLYFFNFAFSTLFVLDHFGFVHLLTIIGWSKSPLVTFTFHSLVDTLSMVTQVWSEFRPICHYVVIQLRQFTPPKDSFFSSLFFSLFATVIVSLPCDMEVSTTTK